MAQPMPTDNPFLQFPYGALQMECDAHDLIVEGEIPADLNGSMYRNGPNQRFRPRGEYHLFAGDGMVHAFHLNDGKASYVNRWVRTAKWNIEDKEGRAVINAMNPFDCEPDFSDFVLIDKEGLANTAISWHGGRLLALEEGHQPYEIDPVTLESIGTWTFRGKLHTAMTAHPKYDPDTGEMIFFAYMATGPFSEDVMLHKANAEGVLTESIHIPTPFSAMIHDFVVTENYIIVPVFPITGSLDRAMEGGPPFAWQPEKGVKIAVLPRNSSSADDVKWFDMDEAFTFHFMNGFDRDGVITIDGSQFEHPPLFPTPDGKSTGPVQPFLNRWTLDLNAAEPRVEFERIDEFESEFPQCDGRYATKAYRHGWYATTDYTHKSGLEANDNYYNAVGHYDHKTRAADRYSFGASTVSEPLFVPKSADAAEGEGYLLTVTTDFETRTSALRILNAQDLASGPIASVHLSHYLPTGFHGAWRPAD
jgi:carotenoid cleavage dioxygenase-like enzyme